MARAPRLGRHSPQSARARTTVMMPEKMRAELQARVVGDGYGLRGKSRWVGEAIARFLALDTEHWLGLVTESDLPSGYRRHEALYLSAALKRQLDASAVHLRRTEPMTEGPMSAIVRTAVTWRLIDEPLLNVGVRQSNIDATD